MSLARLLKNCTKRFNSSAAADAAVAAFKNSAINGANASAFKKLINAIPLKYNSVTKRIESTVGNVPFTQIEGYFRRCDLSGLVRRLNLNVRVPSGLETNLKSVLQVPDWKVRDIDVTYSKARTRGSAAVELDVKNVPNSQSFLSNLSTGAKKKLDSIAKSIKTKAGTGVAVVGVIGGIYLAGDFISNLIRATNERKGCFLVKNVNGKTTSCKLPNRSCVNDEGTACAGGVEYEYNPICWLISKLIKGEDLKDVFDADETVNDTNLQKYLDDADKYEIMYEKYLVVKDDLKNLSICTAFNSIDDGKIPTCRACDPYAETDSSEYFDSSELAENFSLKCVASSSVLETLVDGAVSVGVDILSQIGGFLGLNSNVVKYIFYGIIGIIVLFVVVKLFAAARKK